MSFKKCINKLKASKAARNAAASYVAFFSTTVTGLISIPIAVHYLNKQELGLWTVITAFCMYLGYLELGLGPSTGRKMADSIINKDEIEVRRWWTMTRVVLMVQGAVAIVVGLALAPLFLHVMAKDFPDQRQALILIMAMVIKVGANFPFSGAQGVLTAQNRFHWNPITQSITFWVDLGVFAFLLHMGFGLYAMLGGKVATLLTIWLANWILLSKSDPKLGWDRRGLTMDRFKSLMGFSLNFTAIGLIDTVLKTLPIMMLSSLAGLAMVPLFTLTSKLATVLSSLGQRNYQSFYPGLQKLVVQKDTDEFRCRHLKVGYLSLSMSMVIAAFILCMNRTVVDVLAAPEFYAGPATTAWFAASAITIPLAGLFQMLLMLSGNLGKSSAVALGKLVIGALLYYSSYRFCGLTGLAAVVASLPVINGAYGFWRGAAGCGFKAGGLSRPVVFWGAVAVIAVLAGGYYLNTLGNITAYQIRFHGKTISLPTWHHIAVSGVICLGAVAIFACGFRPGISPKWRGRQVDPL